MANLGLPAMRSLLPTLGLLLCAMAAVAWLSGGADVPTGFYRPLPAQAGFDDADPALQIDQLAAPRPPSFIGRRWAAPYAVNRDWRLLDADFAHRLALVFKIMKQVHGYDMALLEGYRSAARQNVLAHAGAHVTRATGFQSYHQHGLAADCAFLRDGALSMSEKDPWTMRGYRLYGAVAESVGLRWGGRWSLQDFGHAELPLAPTKLRMADGAR